MNERRLLELQIEEAKSDRARLSQIDDQLIGKPEFGFLRFLIAKHVTRLKKAEAARAPLAAAVTQFGIQIPDDRWLFQYAISDENFEKLQATVRGHASRGMLFAGWSPAYFVLWAAEWFRRNHPGGMRRWSDLEDALGTTLNQSDWRALTRRGLASWGRSVISGSSFRYFLSTLAREGGFPTAALSHGNESWASAVLAAMVSAMLAEEVVSEARALEIARSQQGRIPQIFSDEDFLQLCADLALQITRLRKRADSKAEIAGIPVAAWLDAYETGWRDTLPIPRDSKRTKLLDELMSLKAHRLPKGYLEATRYLVRSDGNWVEAVQLELDGELTDAVDRQISRGSGRLWGYASGELSRHLPGELAYLDPETDEKVWLQSSERRDTLHKVPFTCPIELELRTSDKAELKLAVPGGAPVRSHILVFTIDRERDGEPLELMLRGSGSGKYRHETIVVAVPDSWTVDPTNDGEAVEKLGVAAKGAVLWKVSGGALISSPADDGYRVLCGQAADGADTMVLEAAGFPDFVLPSEHQTEIFVGPLRIRLAEGLKQVSTNERLHFREVGSTRWKNFGHCPGHGFFDLAWREGDIIRASRRILLFPEGSSIQRSGTGSGTRYVCNSTLNWTLGVDSDAPVRSVDGGRILQARPQGEIQRRFQAHIDWQDGRDQEAPTMFLEFPCGAGFADWEGRLAPPGKRLTLGDLPSLHAYADGRMRIFGDLIDDDGLVVGGTELGWSFDGKMPLAVVEPELRALLSPHGPKAHVKLGMLDGVEQYWTVHQFEPAVRLESGSLQSQAAVADDGAAIFVRSLSKYSREIELGRYSLGDGGSHRPVPVPDSIHSPFLAYVRAEQAILTRPVWIENSSSPGVPCDELAKVMLEAPPTPAIDSFLEGLGADELPPKSSLDALVRLISSLDGLPPKIFRVLERLSDHPLAIIRALGAAKPDVRPSVLALEKSLPFAWCLLPRNFWASAMQEIASDMYQRLVAAGVPDPGRYYGDMLAEFRVTLLRLQPSAHDLVFPHDKMDLSRAAQSFLNANVDRIGPTSGSMFREKNFTGLPDIFLQLPDHCLETLDAPCAAAAAANGLWTPGRKEIERIKAVNRRYPEYFRAAFAASLD